VLSVPASWRKAAVADIPGLHAEHAVAAAQSGGGYVVAEHLPGRADPTLLPRRLRAALQERLSRPATVALAGTQGYRYDGLRVRGVQGRLRAYAALTSGGVATVLCAGAGASECDEIARTLSLTSAEGRPIRVSEDYSALLEKTVGTLNAGVASVDTSLADAGTPAAQAAAMRGAARLYGGAVASLGRASSGLNPIDLELNARLVAALERLASGYGRVARAAGRGDAAALRRARSRVGRSRSRLAAAAATLRRLGYTAELPKAPATPSSIASSARPVPLSPSSGQPTPVQPSTPPRIAPPPAVKPPPPPRAPRQPEKESGSIG
jgi:hypothetical protein